MKPDTCDCCDYPSEYLTRYDNMHGRDTPPEGVTVWYCGLCAGTETSSMDRYLGPDADDRRMFKVMRTMCYIGNGIIDAIRDVRSAQGKKSESGQ